jgi:hypothetical protein
LRRAEPRLALLRVPALTSPRRLMRRRLTGPAPWVVLPSEALPHFPELCPAPSPSRRCGYRHVSVPLVAWILITFGGGSSGDHRGH